MTVRTGAPPRRVAARREPQTRQPGRCCGPRRRAAADDPPRRVHQAQTRPFSAGDGALGPARRKQQPGRRAGLCGFTSCHAGAGAGAVSLVRRDVQVRSGAAAGEMDRRMRQSVIRSDDLRQLPGVPQSRPGLTSRGARLVIAAGATVPSPANRLQCRPACIPLAAARWRGAVAQGLNPGSVPRRMWRPPGSPVTRNQLPPVPPLGWRSGQYRTSPAPRGGRAPDVGSRRRAGAGGRPLTSAIRAAVTIAASV
jgi:hypothetical protein